MKALRLAALLLTLSSVVGAGGVLAGCGGGGSGGGVGVGAGGGVGDVNTKKAGTPAAEKLQREDLVAVTRGLRQAESSVRREMAAAKIAWPLVANGLPVSSPPATHLAISAAGTTARAILLPPLMSKAQARSLTGPAAGIAGLFQALSGLTGRSWTLIGAASEEIERGSPAAARFARENVALYIDSVYDGHFDGSLIGKSLLKGYTTLGGEPAFGSTLSQAEVQALAGAYSPATEQLHPHPGVELGA